MVLSNKYISCSFFVETIALDRARWGISKGNLLPLLPMIYQTHPTQPLGSTMPRDTTPDLRLAYLPLTSAGINNTVSHASASSAATDTPSPASQRSLMNTFGVGGSTATMPFTFHTIPAYNLLADDD